MDCAAWPRDGDLGLSLWWVHHGPGGVTNLMWSEDGHPWSPFWYGVVSVGLALLAGFVATMLFRR